MATVNWGFGDHETMRHSSREMHSSIFPIWITQVEGAIRNFESSQWERDGKYLRRRTGIAATVPSQPLTGDDLEALHDAGLWIVRLPEYYANISDIEVIEDAVLTLLKEQTSGPDESIAETSDDIWEAALSEELEPDDPFVTGSTQVPFDERHEEEFLREINSSDDPADSLW